MNQPIGTLGQHSWKRVWGRVLGAILFVQLVWWLAIQPLLFSRARPPERIQIAAAEVATLASPELRDLSAAQFKPIELPYHDCCHEPGYRAVRVRFDLVKVPEQGLGLVANTWADNFTIYVNAHVLSQRGRMQLPDITYHGLERKIYFVSPGLLKPGQNELMIVMVRAGIGEFAMGPPLLAEYPALASRLALRDFVLNDYNIISYSIGGVLALLALIMLSRSSERALPAWTLILLLAWALRLVLIDAAEPPVGGLPRIGLGYVMLGLMPIAWLNFVDSWSGRPIRKLPSVSLTAFAVFVAGCVWLIQTQGSNALDALDLQLSIFGSAVSVLVIVRLLWHSFKNPTERIWETAVFVLAISLMVLDLVELLGAQRGFYFHINTSLPLLMLGLATAFYARNVHLFRSMAEFNQLLTRKLAERETELQRGWQERQSLARQAALAEERQRIMRDMHDGIGSRLISLAAQLRGGANESATRPELDRQSVSSELLDALNDMRLIVDSLDTAGDDLGMALGAFRSRIEQRLTDAGMNMTWTIEPEAAAAQYPAGTILHIYRILQEACANVLHHARATHLNIRVQARPDGATSIEVEDDGLGIPEQAHVGRGRANMRARAAQIGAQLEWISQSRGTCVRLYLPASTRGNELGSPMPSPVPRQALNRF